jgi:hypothetical protein
MDGIRKRRTCKRSAALDDLPNSTRKAGCWHHAKIALQQTAQDAKQRYHGTVTVV